MSPEKQRIKIAEACGWTRVPVESFHKFAAVTWPVFEKEGRRASIHTNTLPDYLNDLNACHEMEKALTDEQRGIYADHLCNSVKASGDGPGTALLKAFFATAAQRCEAFLKTLNLWEEEP